MPEVFMPRLSDTMTEGTVSTWTKKVGDRVEKGDVLAEIETDKATMELEAYDAGVLEQIVVDAGGTVPIGEVIAVIGDGSGVGKDTGTGVPAGDATPAAPAADAPPEPPVSAHPGTPNAVGAHMKVEAPATVSLKDAAAGSWADGTQVKASPLARALARDAGLNLSTVRGSGPGGRIVRADVQDAIAAMASGGRPRATASPSTSAPVAQEPSPFVSDASDVEEVPLSNIRKVTARRLVESMQQAPHFYLTSVIDADQLVDARARINSGLAALAGAGGAPVRISVNDLVVKAVASALRAHPEVNVSFATDKLLRHRRIHVGVAVALPDGLIVPVIRDADTKTVTQISAETRDLATRARAGKLKPEEFTGSTFSVSNLGMFGVDQFTAVINPPEAAILAVGATKQEPVAREGQIVVGHTMRVTLSIDHRALDGATAAKFLADLRALLENPLATLA
jgi:pyruvate dehydrogenase E2 component (dihydrolipoamide acetyltransferase)